jgi:enoyl-CoA hydratase/carnithine racemase
MAKAYVTRTGDVAELVISAPPLNLFDAQLATDLEDALDEIIAQCWPGGTTPGKPPIPGEPIPPEPRWARAVLLRAEGKVFCAGVDVHEFQGLGPSQGAALMARFLALVQTLERMPVPTIAVVHALNLTIGFELSLGCDLMWAAEDASFGLVEATVGLTPGGGGTQRLVARAGVARAATRRIPRRWWKCERTTRRGCCGGSGGPWVNADWTSARPGWRPWAPKSWTCST